MISRRSFIKSSAAAAAMTAVSTEAAQAAAETTEAPAKPAAKARPGSPNILIFLPDQQNGATVLPGSPVVKPVMDKFLQEAVAFNSAHCPAPHCCPSRASFMTGLYPSEHGVYNNVLTNTAIHFNPYPGTEYWGQWLRDAGYATGYAGKLHVGRDVKPEDCGFEDLSSIEQGEPDPGRSKRKWNVKETAPADRQPGEVVRPDWGSVQLYKTLPNAGPKGYEGMDDYRIMQGGIAGMKKYAAGDKPWCVMISNSGGHDVYDAPKKFVDLYDVDKIELPASFRDTLDDKPRVYQRQRYEYWSQLSDHETRDALRHYYAKLSMQDAIFGEMLQALEETGQAENTIVIYVSDHGDYHAAHGLWMKGVPSFQEAYHIPAVVRWPKGTKQPGRQVDALVDQVDWSATILEACGITPPKKISGASMLPWLRGEAPADWRTASCTQMNGVELYYTQRIVLTKEWKYVYNGFDYDELYDLRNDPHEMHNLAFPDIAARTKQVQSGEGLTTGSVPWPVLTAEVEQARKRLVAEMWRFAGEHNDIIFNSYGTVALAPYGPALAESAGKEKK